MKILYVSTTPYSGIHLTQADLVGRLGHDTRALTPATWLPAIKKMGPDRKVVGRAYWIGDRDLVNECLEWADAVHFNYTASFSSLGRQDLLGKKVAVWHLATKWKDGFMRYFPGLSARRYKFVVSAEGWDRYELPPWRWQNVPVLFPINDKLWRPIPFEKRQRRATMTPRLMKDEWGGKPIPAPRAVDQVKAALRGLPFDVFSGMGWVECMCEKASSWVGIDDVVNPMLHLSGFEYLSLGVPCINSGDDHVMKVLSEVTGGAPWPFVTQNGIASFKPEEICRSVEILLETFPSEFARYGEASRSWMEQYYSGERMAERYVELYR